MIRRTFIRSTILAAGTALTLCGFAHAQNQVGVPAFAAPTDVVTEAVKLRYMKPSELVRFFMRPDPLAKPGTINRSFVSGLNKFVPNDVTGTVTISASSTQLVEYKSLIRFLDVEPRTLRLKIRLLRYEFAPDAKDSDAPKITEIAKTEADAVNNGTVDLPLVAGETLFYGKIGVHVNGDSSISIGVKMRTTGEPEDLDWKAVSALNRTLQTGKSYLFLDGGADRTKVNSFNDTYERLIGVNTGYYLEVTPLLNPLKDEKAAKP